MKNKKKTKEFFMDIDNTDLNTKGDKEKSEFDKENKNNDKEKTTKQEMTKLAGLNEKFPEENFVDIESTQNSKKIKLHTYKYPAKGNIKGIVYLL